MLGDWTAPEPPALDRGAKDRLHELNHQPQDDLFFAHLRQLEDAYRCQQKTLNQLSAENAELRQRCKEDAKMEEYASVQQDSLTGAQLGPTRMLRGRTRLHPLRKASTVPAFFTDLHLLSSQVQSQEEITTVGIQRRVKRTLTGIVSLVSASDEDATSKYEGVTSKYELEDGRQLATTPPMRAWCSSKESVPEGDACIPSARQRPSGIDVATRPSSRPSAFTFRTRQHWTRARASQRRISPASPAYFRRQASMLPEEGQKEDVVGNAKKSCWTPHIIAPSSPQRVAWDVAGMVLLIYDIIMIPMQVYSLPSNAFLVFMDWVTLLFWSCDMLWSVSTGYVHKGHTVMSPRLILRNYLRTWFTLDVVVVGPDWVFTILELTNASAGGGGNVSKLLRALRAVRAARLLRLAKLKRVMSMLKDRIESEVMFIVANVFKLVVMLLFVNHFIGALWYLIGVIGKGSDMRNWIDEHGFDKETLLYRYTTSLHWSLTQFTPGSMHVQPQNVMERTFSILVLVFGLILFSSFISSITASLTQLRNMQGETPKQFWLLRRYVRQRNVPQELAFRILRYAEHACSTQKDLVPESRLWILQVLSEQLSHELEYFVSFSSLRLHPLFEQASHMSQVTMPRLCTRALKRRSLAVGDVLFKEENMATHMHVVVSGKLHYVRMTSEDGELDRISENDWLAEAALWTEWTHVGNAWAATEGVTISIGVDAFAEVIGNDPVLWPLFSNYAKNFVEWLQNQHHLELTDAFGEDMHHKVASFMGAHQDRHDIVQLF